MVRPPEASLSGEINDGLRVNVFSLESCGNASFVPISLSGFLPRHGISPFGTSSIMMHVLQPKEPSQNSAHAGTMLLDLQNCGLDKLLFFINYPVSSMLL